MLYTFISIAVKLILLPLTICYWCFKIPLDFCHNLGTQLPLLVRWTCWLLLFPFWIIFWPYCKLYEPVYNAVYKNWPIFKPEEYDEDYEDDYDEEWYNDYTPHYTITVSHIKDDGNEENPIQNDMHYMYHELRKLREQYNGILRRHQQLEQEIGQAYSVANNYTGFDSKEMLLCIQKCNEDFELIPDILEYYNKENSIHNKYGEPGYDRNTCFYSVKRMIIIMEKTGKYDDALELCHWALNNGLILDGTEGGIIGRMARIAKKRDSEIEKTIK